MRPRAHGYIALDGIGPDVLEDVFACRLESTVGRLWGEAAAEVVDFEGEGRVGDEADEGVDGEGARGCYHWG